MKSATFDVSTATTTALVAADADTTKFIRVLGLEVYAHGVTDAAFKSDATTKYTASFAAAGPRVLPVDFEGWFDCAAGAPLNLVTSQAVRVTGVVRYAVYG